VLLYFLEKKNMQTPKYGNVSDFAKYDTVLTIDHTLLREEVMFSYHPQIMQCIRTLAERTTGGGVTAFDEISYKTKNMMAGVNKEPDVLPHLSEQVNVGWIPVLSHVVADILIHGFSVVRVIKKRDLKLDAYFSCRGVSYANAATDDPEETDEEQELEDGFSKDAETEVQVKREQENEEQTARKKEDTDNKTDARAKRARSRSPDSSSKRSRSTTPPPPQTVDGDVYQIDDYQLLRLDPLGLNILVKFRASDNTIAFDVRDKANNVVDAYVVYDRMAIRYGRHPMSVLRVAMPSAERLDLAAMGWTMTAAKEHQPICVAYSQTAKSQGINGLNAPGLEGLTTENALYARAEEESGNAAVSMHTTVKAMQEAVERYPTISQFSQMQPTLRLRSNLASLEGMQPVADMARNLFTAPPNVNVSTLQPVHSNSHEHFTTSHVKNIADSFGLSASLVGNDFDHVTSETLRMMLHNVDIRCKPIGAQLTDLLYIIINTRKSQFVHKSLQHRAKPVMFVLNSNSKSSLGDLVQGYHLGMFSESAVRREFERSLGLKEMDAAFLPIVEPDALLARAKREYQEAQTYALLESVKLQKEQLRVAKKQADAALAATKKAASEQATATAATSPTADDATADKEDEGKEKKKGKGEIKQQDKNREKETQSTDSSTTEKEKADKKEKKEQKRAQDVKDASLTKQSRFSKSTSSI
jgi:hypothetical protein